MQLRDKIVVVTGGAHGIGRALCKRFTSEGARAVVVADLDGPAARRVAARIGGTAVTTDVASEADITELVQQTLRDFGVIDLFFAPTPESSSRAASMFPTTTGSASGTSTSAPTCSPRGPYCRQ